MGDSIVISDHPTAEDINEWDSLMHVTLVLATEKEFSIRLKAAEVVSLANVGHLIDIIEMGSS
jgi:acyl carrier protein